MNFNTLRTYFFIFSLASLFLLGCKKEEITDENRLMWVGNSPEAGIQRSPYLVKLENKIENKDKTFTWIWSVVNSNPGSGSPESGTVQDLVSWGITLGSCANVDQIIYGSTSPDGITWTNFEPKITLEAAIFGFSKPLLMFNQGTIKNQKSYYKLVVLPKLSTTPDISAVYKSGSLTGSGAFTMSGFGCLAN
jgi:hypothetical protein